MLCCFTVTFCRQMLLCRVTLGKSFLQFSAIKMAHAPPGHHSVIGRPSTGGLTYAEYVVYRGEQVSVRYKVVTLAHKALFWYSIIFIISPVTICSIRVINSTSANLLTVSRLKFAFSSRAFCVSTCSKFLNNTALDSQIFLAFKRHLKTHLFRSVLTLPPSEFLKCCLDSLLTLELYKLFTYLLKIAHCCCLNKLIAIVNFINFQIAY